MQEVYKPQCGQKDAKKQPEVKNTHSREQTVFQNYKLLNAKAALQGRWVSGTRWLEGHCTVSSRQSKSRRMDSVAHCRHVREPALQKQLRGLGALQLVLCSIY